jgi:hypothetical protein
MKAYENEKNFFTEQNSTKKNQIKIKQIFNRHHNIYFHHPD